MSSLQMPKVDNSIMISRDKIISEVKKIVNPDNVLSHIDEIKPYETDALAAYKQIPLLVVLPETVEEVSNVLKYCNENKIKIDVSDICTICDDNFFSFRENNTQERQISFIWK